MMVRYSRSSCATGRRAAAPAAPPRCARASCRSCTASLPPAAGSAMRRRSASGTMGAALRDAHEGLRSLSPRERAGGARDRLRGPPVPGTPAAARRAVAWGLQTCFVLRDIHAQVTVNSFQSRVPCVAVRGRRSGAEPRARESAHTGTTANSWLHRAEGREKRERRGREGERERGREGVRGRGREGERERGREEERKRGRKEGREEKGERERERGIRKKRGRERGYLRSIFHNLKIQMFGKTPQARVLTLEFVHGKDLLSGFHTHQSACELSLGLLRYCSSKITISRVERGSVRGLNLQ